MAKVKKYNEMSVEELNLELNNCQAALFNFRFQKTLQQLESPHQIKNIKKNIARIKTFINQKK